MRNHFIKRHHGKEELVEISYPLVRQVILEWPKMIRSMDKLEIMEQPRRIKAQEEMGKDEMRRSRSRRNGYAIQASRLRQSGMSTTRRTSRTGRGAKHASRVGQREGRV